MSKHLFGLIATGYGAAANNRGDNDGGNITTLQKLLWKGDVHTTVSAEAIRWAIRYYWDKNGHQVNRQWDEEKYEHDWRDHSWAPWTSNDEKTRQQPTFVDDDVLGFMLAEAATTDGNDQLDQLKKEKKELDAKIKSATSEEKKGLKERAKDLKGKIDLLSKGKADKRRGALEVTRAISLSPFAGDISFNAKSGEKTRTSLYGTELHTTRYQYGFALTPDSLREKRRVLDVVEAIINLSEVGGNHSRFLFDFSPASVILRWTDDFAPRLLYGFEMDSEGVVRMSEILRKVRSGDIDPKELFIGGEVVATLDEKQRELLNGAELSDGVKSAKRKLCDRIVNDLAIEVAGIRA